VELSKTANELAGNAWLGYERRHRVAIAPNRFAAPLAAMTQRLLAFHDLLVSVPKQGRYDLALLTGDDEIATQPVLIGPADVLRGDLA
jgi:hypothetical protein